MKLQQAILTCVIMLLILVATQFSVANDRIVLLYAMAAIPLGIYLINRPDVWFAVTISLFYSGLKLPQLPANIMLFHVSALGLSMLIVLKSIMSKERSPAYQPLNGLILLFVMNLVLIIMFRGIGLRFLGSHLNGGSHYFVLGFMLALLYLCPSLSVSPKLLRRGLIGMCVLSLIPGLAQFLFTFSGGRLYHMYYFVEVRGFIAESFMAVQNDMGFTRFNTGALSYLAFIPLVYFHRPFYGNKLLLTLLFIFIAFSGALLSGSRHNLIQLITFLFFWSLSKDRKINWRAGALIGLISVFTVGFIALFAHLLPLPVQRAFSIVPWASVSDIVSMDARLTFNWRLDLWKRGIQEIPKYLIIGKGFSFDPRLMIGLEELGDYSYQWAYIVGAWHNGLLSLFLNTGLLGTIAGLSIFRVAIRRHTKPLLSAWSNPSLERINHVCYAALCNLVFHYIFIGGDVQSHFPGILIFVIMLEVIFQAKRAVEQAEPTGPLRVARSRIRPF